MSQHFKRICGHCGKVIAQCRCMSCDKDIQYATCDECQKKKITVKEVGCVVYSCEPSCRYYTEMFESPACKSCIRYPNLSDNYGEVNESR